MKLIELLTEENINSIISASDFRKKYYKELDLDREPSPKGEGNRLSPLTIPKPDPVFDRATGPLGALKKDGSKKESKNKYPSADYDIVPTNNSNRQIINKQFNESRQTLEKKILKNRRGYYVHKKRTEIGIDDNHSFEEIYKHKLHEDVTHFLEAFADQRLDTFFQGYFENFLENYKNIKSNTVYPCYIVELKDEDFLLDFSIDKLKQITLILSLQNKKLSGRQLLNYKNNNKFLYQTQILPNQKFLMIFNTDSDAESFSSHLGLSSDQFSTENSKIIVRKN